MDRHASKRRISPSRIGRFRAKPGRCGVKSSCSLVTRLLERSIMPGGHDLGYHERGQSGRDTLCAAALATCVRVLARAPVGPKWRARRRDGRRRVESGCADAIGTIPRAPGVRPSWSDRAIQPTISKSGCRPLEDPHLRRRRFPGRSTCRAGGVLSQRGRDDDRWLHPERIRRSPCCAVRARVCCSGGACRSNAGGRTAAITARSGAGPRGSRSRASPAVERRIRTTASGSG